MLSPWILIFPFFIPYLSGGEEKETAAQPVVHFHRGRGAIVDVIGVLHGHCPHVD